MKSRLLKSLFHSFGRGTRVSPVRARAARTAEADPPIVPDALEARRLLSVTVNHDTTANTLYITGDNNDNEIYVYQNNGTPDQIRVEVTGQGTYGPFNVDADLTSISISGGGGADGITIGNSSNPISGDEPVSVTASVNGGADNDTLTAGDSGDILYGDAGSDNIFGGPGADLIQGGDGDDFLYGDDGNDVMYGEAGNDSLEGGTGDDTLWGDDLSGAVSGTDTLAGGGDDDYLAGGYGDDTLRGESGDDTLYGDYTAGDTLNGGADLLVGGGGADAMYGGYGDDTLDGSTGEGASPITDYLDGGAGTDSATWNGSDVRVGIP